MVPALRRQLKACLVHLPPNALEEVSIALVNDRTMSALHAISHNDLTPTDVLTYELDHAPQGDVTQGEIVICVPEARRRCVSDRMDLGREILLYALHGMLHLCGMDDRRKADFDRMHDMEDRILTAVGIGPVFHNRKVSRR